MFNFINNQTLKFEIFFFTLFTFLYSPTVVETAAEPWQTNFQDPATDVMFSIINFYDDLMVIVWFIFIIVTYLLIASLTSRRKMDVQWKVLWEHKPNLSQIIKLTKNIEENNYNRHNVIRGRTIEIIWTFLPIIILCIIAIPSFALLYSQESLLDYNSTLRITGHQWFWAYDTGFWENPDMTSDFYNSVLHDRSYEAYIIPEELLNKGDLRLLEVDTIVYFTLGRTTRLLITSVDVIHSWAVPSFGIKVDAVPGRINQTVLTPNRIGTFYGQCSEICGVNHGMMPIITCVLDNHRESLRDLIVSQNYAEMLADIKNLHNKNLSDEEFNDLLDTYVKKKFVSSENVAGMKDWIKQLNDLADKKKLELEKEAEIAIEKKLAVESLVQNAMIFKLGDENPLNKYPLLASKFGMVDNFDVIYSGLKYPNLVTSNPEMGYSSNFQLNNIIDRKLVENLMRFVPGQDISEFSIDQLPILIQSYLKKSTEKNANEINIETIEKINNSNETTQ